MEISVLVDVDSVQRQLLYLQNQGVRKAAALALNDTAFAARRDVQGVMRRVFDRPTPWTLNVPFVTKARPNSLWASVDVLGRFKRYNERGAATGIYDKPYGESEDKSFLSPHIEGGPRSAKRLEVLLRRFDMLGPNEFVVPSKYMRLDGYGNISRGTIQQITANLRINMDSLNNTKGGVDTSGGKSKAARNRTQFYFTRRGVRGQKHSIIWQRFTRGHAVPALIVVSGAPRYRNRFPFAETAQATVARVWPVEFERQVLSEIRR